MWTVGFEKSNGPRAQKLSAPAVQVLPPTFGWLTLPHLNVKPTCLTQTNLYVANVRSTQADKRTGGTTVA